MNWNYSSNQKTFTTKVVRLTIKVNFVKKKFRKNWKKSDQNGINWNYSSNQKMSLTKVVRLAMKVKTVEKNLKNKNWIKIE